MQQLSVVISKIHGYFESRSLSYFNWIRLLVGLVLFEILCEHLLDAEFIATTSRIYINTSPDLPELQRQLAGIFLSSGAAYTLFLSGLMILTALYATGLGSIAIVWILPAAEWVFQTLNTRNLYAHEYVVHNFIMLLCVIEIGQGRLKIKRSAPVHWKRSVVSGVAITLIKLQFLLIYFMAGLGKVLSPEWNKDDVLDRVFLNSRYPSIFFDFILTDYKTLTPYLIIAVKVFLMSFPLAIMTRRFRKPAVAAGILFHVTVALKIGLYGFGVLMISLYLLFFDRPATADKVANFRN